jgi:transcriptional regulator with XRE-family HTH domain
VSTPTQLLTKSTAAVTVLGPKRAFGLRLKQLRDEAGLSQEDLADAAGLFRTYMSRIETGLANPTLTVICALSEALNIGPYELLIPPDDRLPKRTKSKAAISRGRVLK